MSGHRRCPAAVPGSATATTTATTLVSVAPGLHFGDDLGVILGREGLVRDPEQLVFSRDVCAVGVGQAERRIEQGLAGHRPRLAVEVAYRGSDIVLELDLQRVL